MHLYHEFGPDLQQSDLLLLDERDGKVFKYSFNCPFNEYTKEMVNHLNIAFKCWEDEHVR